MSDTTLKYSNPSSTSTVAGNGKKELTTYVDQTAVAPSPSRDYYRLQVTDDYVWMTRWQISNKFASNSPIEMRVPLEKYLKEPGLASEVGRIFGKSLANYVEGLSQGHFDRIIRLPVKPLALIMEYVGIKAIGKLAPVCKRFNEIASSDTLWKGFFTTYAGQDGIPKEMVDQANYFGWKTMFLIQGIQDKAFPGRKMKLGGLGRAERRDEIGSGDRKKDLKGKDRVPKLIQRQLQQQNQKAAAGLKPPKAPIRFNKSLDYYLNSS